MAFNDSAAALYRHVTRHHPDITSVYIVKSRSLFYTLRSQEINVAYAYSLKGLWLQLRARVVFFSHKHNREYVAAALWRNNVLLCQLWHGTPLKKIGFSDPERLQYESRWYVKLSRIAMPWVDMRWGMMTASSARIADIFAADFEVDKVVVTGYPRLDKAKQGDITHDPVSIKKVIYMPTFRGSIGTDDSHAAINNLIRETGFDVVRIDRLLQQWGMELIIRLHPSNKLDAKFQQEISGAKCISFEDISVDFYQAINEYDVLITDYSSVFFDFLVTGKPIIHAGFDVEDYLKFSRDMYFDYAEVCLTPEIKNWDDILTTLSAWQQSGCSQEYVAAYRHLKQWSNVAVDASQGSYSEQVVAAVQDVLHAGE